MASTRTGSKSAAKKNGRRTDSAVTVGRIGPEQTSEFLNSICRQAPWDLWAQKLADRKRPEPLHKLVPKSAGAPLGWSLSLECEAATSELVKWLSALSRHRRSSETPGDWSAIAVDWLDSLPARPLTDSLAIEYVAWAHALPRLSTRLSAELWAQIFAVLVNAAVDALELSWGMPILDDGPADSQAAEQFVLNQMTAGELPLTLGYIFPKIELCDAVAKRGGKMIDQGMLTVMDGEGMPHATVVPSWRMLLACWTRCGLLERSYRPVCFSPEAKLQFEWFVRQTLRWRCGDGTLPMGTELVSGRTLDGLIATATSLGGDRVDRDIYAVSCARLQPDDSDYALPQPGEHSEWSQLAVLRSTWLAKSIHAAVVFDQGTFKGQLTCGATPIWRGSLMPEIRVEGKPMRVSGEWEELCWSSDDDMDFIELEIELQGKWKLQRQLMVAREDRFVFMADALIGPRSAPIDYRLEFPLQVNEVHCTPQSETTEIRLSNEKVLGWAIPLGLSEWKVDGRSGAFDGRVLHQVATGSALYAPVFWDLEPKRRRKSHTWRRLTVAQDLQILPPDVAQAFRIQVSNKQWVVYRSLGKTGNRTFMGHNLTSEFLLARFLKNGEFENLIEIE